MIRIKMCVHCKSVTGCIKDGDDKFCVISNCDKKNGVCESVALLVAYQADEIQRVYSVCGPCAFQQQKLVVANH